LLRKRQLLQQVAAVQLGRPASNLLTPHLKLANGAKEVPPKAGKEAEVPVSMAGSSSR
jgi:hypothetical protein